MNTTPFNPDDLLFLASRGIDGDLSREERARLEEAIRTSPTLQNEASEMEAASRLVARWALPPAACDEATFHDLVVAHVKEQPADPRLAKVDALLGLWRESAPDGQPDLSAGVLAQIRGRRRAPVYRLVFRLAAPLAAAAAIALAFGGPTWFRSAREPVSYVVVGPHISTVATAKSSDERRVVVSFLPSAQAPAATESQFGYMTIGVEAAAITDEGSPL